MTENQKTDTNERLPFSRRDILKLAGAAGTLNAYGTRTATAADQKRIIVGTTPGHADVARKKANQVIRTLDFDDIGQAVVGRWPEQALQGLQRNPHVRYIEEEERTISLDSHGGQHLSWGADRIDAEVAHAAGHRGAGVNVAIIDSGIDSRHDDLVDNLHDSLHTAPAECDTSIGNGDCPEDWHDNSNTLHGTGVAGIVGAVDNGQDVIGVAPDVTLHAVKVTWGDGDGFPSDLAAGLEWCANNGIDVANMSLGGAGDNDTVEDAMQCARDNDVVLVSSAGNEGGGDVTYPGAFDQDIAVSGITELDELSTTSSTGPEVDIAGPTRSGSGQTGRGVLTTRRDGGTVRFGGTSAAAPHVTGTAALLIEDGVHPDNVQSELEGSAEDLGLDSEEQGAGLVDTASALGLDSANDLLAVETRPAEDKEFTEATLKGELTHQVGSDSAEVFFEYSKHSSVTWDHRTPTETISGIVPNNDSETFERTVTGLEEDTRYDVRAGVTVEEPSEGWSATEFGESVSFRTADNLHPTASFTHDPDVPDPGDVVTFDASESFDPEDDTLTYEWNLGDGTTASGVEVTHTYAVPGEVTVTLTVMDEFGQTDVMTTTLRVNEAPNADFSHTPALPNEDEQVEFDATDSGDPDGDIVEYEWDFGDGSVETTTAPIRRHTYAIGDYGEHDVTLTVTDNDDATDEVIKTIRINAFPRAAFDVVNDRVIRNESVEFDASASVDRDPGLGGAIETYEWDFGDGTTQTTTDPTVEHTYTTGGEKTVTLRVVDNDGASHDTISVHEEAFTVYIRVEVAIKPEDNGPNTINPRARGDVPVAVLTTPAFDAPARLDPSTLHFGDPDDVGFDATDTPAGGATPSHSGGHVEDVDDDGDMDTLLHFRVQDADFDSADTEGQLAGLTDNGVPVFGTDSVHVL